MSHSYYPRITAWLLFGILAASTIRCKSPEKLFAENKQKAPYDAIIVPGVPYKDSSMRDVMNLRVYWSRYLFENGLTKNIIYSGSAVYTPYVEASIMAMMGQELGIPEEHIFTETQAEHSVENLFYSYRLAKEKGFERVALATDPFQTRMTNRFRRKNFPDMARMPILFDTLRSMEKPFPPVDAARARVDEESFTPLTEQKNWYQRWRGTRGKNIKEELKEYRENRKE